MSNTAAKIIESWKSEDLNEVASNSPAGHIRLVSSAGELRKQGYEIQANSVSCLSTSCLSTDCLSTSCLSTSCLSTDCLSTSCLSTSCLSTECATVFPDCV